MEHIYMLQEERFYVQDLPIIKIGRSGNILVRLGRAPNYKKARIFACISVNNSKLVERKLIDTFKGKFKKVIDYGSEYFEGDITKMYGTFMSSLISLYSNEVDPIQEIEDVPEVLVSTKTVIDDKDTFKSWTNDQEDYVIDKSSRARCKKTEVYKSYINWCISNHVCPIEITTFYKHMTQVYDLPEFDEGKMWCGMADNKYLECENDISVKTFIEEYYDGSEKEEVNRTDVWNEYKTSDMYSSNVKVCDFVKILVRLGYESTKYTVKGIKIRVHIEHEIQTVKVFMDGTYGTYDGSENRTAVWNEYKTSDMYSSNVKVGDFYKILADLGYVETKYNGICMVKGIKRRVDIENEIQLVKEFMDSKYIDGDGKVCRTEIFDVYKCSDMVIDRLKATDFYKILVDLGYVETKYNGIRMVKGIKRRVDIENEIQLVKEFMDSKYIDGDGKVCRTEIFDVYKCSDMVIDRLKATDFYNILTKLEYKPAKVRATDFYIILGKLGYADVQVKGIHMIKGIKRKE